MIGKQSLVELVSVRARASYYTLRICLLFKQLFEVRLLLAYLNLG